MIPVPPPINAAQVQPPSRPVKRTSVTGVDNRLPYLLTAINNSPDTHFIVCLHDSEPVMQDGPMCGLVAISMACSLLHGKVLESASPNELLLKAQQQGYSKQGEMFSAEQLLSLSEEQLQCSGVLLTFDNIKSIISSTITGSSLLFPYDADKDHSPCQLNGHKAHWAVTVGCVMLLSNKDIDYFIPFCDNKGEYYLLDRTKIIPQLVTRYTESVTEANTWLLCRHGKSRHLGMWSLSNIRQSNANLKEPGPSRIVDDCIIPAGGLVEGLCGKAVLLQKKYTTEMK